VIPLTESLASNVDDVRGGTE